MAPSPPPDFHTPNEKEAKKREATEDEQGEEASEAHPPVLSPQPELKTILLRGNKLADRTVSQKPNKLRLAIDPSQPWPRLLHLTTLDLSDNSSPGNPDWLPPIAVSVDSVPNLQVLLLVVLSGVVIQYDEMLRNIITCSELLLSNDP